jgi:hypothetical protein
VLKPLGWGVSIAIAALLSSAYFHLEPWIVYMFAVFACLGMALYLGAYLYCLFTDRDALRSETYTIQKLAIEKGFVGDSLTGVLPTNELPAANCCPRLLISHRRRTSETALCRLDRFQYSYAE